MVAPMNRLVAVSAFIIAFVFFFIFVGLSYIIWRLRKRLFRTQSAPNNSNRARLTSGNQKNFPHHEQENIKSKIEPHQYKAILDLVATTMATTDSTNKEDVSERFMKELLKIMKDNKDPELYQTIQNYTSTENEYQYVEIMEYITSMKDKGNEFYSDDYDDDYATFHCPKSAMLTSGINKSPNNLKNNVSLGTNDHLKYLKESKSRCEDGNNEPPYLEAKSFTATPDCPPQLQKLCQNQVVPPSIPPKPSRTLFRPDVNVL